MILFSSSKRSEGSPLATRQASPSPTCPAGSRPGHPAGPSRLWRAWLAALLLACGAGRAEANLARLEELVATRPEDLRLHYLLGRRYTEQGDHRKAAEQFQAVLDRLQARNFQQLPETKRSPTLAVVKFQLGLALARTGELTRAILAWTELLEEVPDNKRTMSYLGLALFKQGLASPNEELRQRLFEESLDWWKRLVKLDPADLKARYFLGIEYFKMGRVEDAARQWLLFLRVQKRHPKVLALLAKALIKLGRKTQAGKTLDLLQSLEATQSSPALADFVRKARAELERAGDRPGRADLDDSETQPNAVTQDPPGTRPQPPDGPEPGPPPLLEPRGPAPPTAPPEEPVTLQAETLFLDGLDYKEKGNLEKALFAFLQAIDIEPEFTQVYLQIGEVYLGLAGLAPTPDQFEERLHLAEGALSKVKTLSPNTLLSHAANSKLVLIKQAEQQGFVGYHEQLGKTAVGDHRESDAFEEFVLLLSTGDFRPSTFLQLAAILGRLTEGNRQDLRFFLEEAENQHPGHPLATYLLGRTYMLSKDEKQASDGARDKLSAALEGIAKDKDFKEPYLAYAQAPEADPVDHYLAARLLARDQVPAKALEQVNIYLKAAPKTHVFYRDATQLKEQLGVTAPAGIKAPGQAYRDELKMLQDTVRESHVFFGEGDEGTSLLTASHLEDLARFRAIKTFVDGQPGHGLARFLLAWMLLHQASSPKEGGDVEGMRKEAHRLLDQLHKDQLRDPWYHHMMALQVLKWSLVSKDLGDEAKAFFKTARQILWAQGRLRDAPMARDTAQAALWWIEKGEVAKAELLAEQVKSYDPESLETQGLGFQLALAQGKFFGALALLPAWTWEALGRFWTRQILLADLALLLFLSFTFTALAWSVMVVARYLPELQHLMHELWKAKGWVLPLSLLLPAAMVLAFPTGLIVFVPFLAFPVMTTRERWVHGFLLTAMVVTPLFLPLSLGANFGLLRAYEQVASGDLEGVATKLQAEVDAQGPDFLRLYLLSLVYLRDGDLEQAELTLGKLAKLEPGHPGVLVNQAVRLARRGDYDEARKYFSEALKKDPSSVPALIGLAGIHAIQGNAKEAESHEGWAKQMNRDGRYPLQELSEIPADVTRMPLLDAGLPPEALAPYFRFYGGENFLALNTTLLAFLTWLLVGGGLLGFLLFTRERMEIELKVCNHCRQVMCTSCQKAVATKALCPSCANPDSRPSLVGDEARRLRGHEALRRAQAANLLLPGVGLAFTGRTELAAFFPLLISFLALIRLEDGGRLLNIVFPGLTLGGLEPLLDLALVLAVLLYLGAQALLWRLRDEVVAG